MRRSVVGLAVLALCAAACGDQVPAQLEFIGVNPGQPRLGEIATVQFIARDSRGEPMAGVTVEFTLEGSGTTAEDPVPSGVLLHTPTALTNRGSGVVEAQISSNRVQSVIVVATVGDPAADGKQVRSPPVTFAGASTPNAIQLTFQCGTVAGTASGGVHAINAYNETRDLIAGVKVNCYAHVGDRNGDGIPGAVVSFLAEAGTIGPSATSVSDVVGNAETLYKTSLPLPAETQPTTWSMAPVTTTLDSVHMPFLVAPLWMHAFDWRENPIATPPSAANQNEPRRFDPIRGASFELNPRDNLVALIAVTTGEEGYIDENNNGVYDSGEIFEPFDLTEPFVDSNDNGTWDADERWVDGNGDGLWDGKNGRHDSNTLIWVMERILWTGIPHFDDKYDPVSPVFKQTPPGSVSVPRLGVTPDPGVELYYSDPWYNSMAQNGGADGCKPEGGGQIVDLWLDKSNGWVGQALSYPSPAWYRFLIGDVRKVGPDGGLEPPGPMRVLIGGECKFTGSPQGGYVLGIGYTITANLQP